MTRQYKREFVFQYPLKHKVVRNLKIVTEHIGDLQVEGVAYYDPSASLLDDMNNRYAVDIDFIKWNGTDIKPVLEVAGTFEDIEEATIRHCAVLFEEKFTSNKKAA